MKRIYLILGVIVLLVSIAAFALGRGSTNAPVAPNAVFSDQWEYLVVSGATNINLTPSSGNPRTRKEPIAPFGRESFVLEHHLDQLGEKGWELIEVGGSASDPLFFFKRKK